MTFAMGWIFHSWSQWSIYIFILIASFLGHLMFNHQEERNGVGGASEKRLNMGKYAFFALAYAFAGLAGEVVNKEPAARTNLPVLFAAWIFLLWDVGDWISLIVYRMATHTHGGKGLLLDAVLALRSWGDKIRKVIERIRVPRAVKVLVALAFVSAMITACVLILPTEPPSLPQLTAGANNATYEAGTATAGATELSTKFDTSTPAATASPTPTPCCGGEIIEVTPLGGPYAPWIIITGDINEAPQPGVWYWSPGRYYSYEDWNLRECHDLSCGITGGMYAAETVDTVGGLVDSAGAIWRCKKGPRGEGYDWGEDTHGAQWCTYSFLAWDPVHLAHGTYEVIE